MKEDVDERPAGESRQRKRGRRLNPTRIAVENDKRRPIALNPAPKERESVAARRAVRAEMAEIKVLLRAEKGRA
jgi:hypothetical protein